jgi:hypothetical protein
MLIAEISLLQEFMQKCPRPGAMRKREDVKGFGFLLGLLS